MNAHAVVLISIFTGIIVIAVCMIWYSIEAFSQGASTWSAGPSALKGLPNVVQPQPFEHSEEEAYNLKHALVSLMVYGGLPDDVVGEILANVYAQKQEDFPGPDECLIWLLPSLFDYDLTPEGDDYWDDIDTQLDLVMTGRDPETEEWIREALEPTVLSVMRDSAITACKLR